MGHSGLRVPVLRQDRARDRFRPQAALRARRKVRREGQGDLPQPGAALARELHLRA